MSNFKIEKNGYDINQVDQYLITLNSSYESKLQEQKIRISDLRRELDDTKAQLDSYKNKNSNISDALVVAVETAKQIEKSSKNIYDLEIKRIRKLYDKWQSFLDEFMKKYPELQSKYDTKLLLKMFSDDIDNILSQNKKTIEQKEVVAVNQINEPNTIGLRQLLNKMGSINRTNLFTNKGSDKANNQIVRNPRPSEETMENYEVQHAVTDECKRIKDLGEKAMSGLKLDKDEKYENLVDKFLSSDDEKYEDSAYSKILLEKQKNDGFNLKEAVTPTEDLSEIMKSFSFYPENEKKEKKD